MKLEKKLQNNSHYIPVNGCVLWTAAQTSDGYGIVYWEKKDQLAHRLSYSNKHGDIPTGMCILHKCDTPCCINPDHLFIGTKKDNAIDRIKKGRFLPLKGDKSPFKKLSDNDIESIRKDKRTQKLIAAQYGVTQQHISAIKNNKERTI